MNPTYNRKVELAKHRTCLCGRPATVFKSSDYICERCNRIEKAMRSEATSEGMKRHRDLKLSGEL